MSRLSRGLLHPGEMGVFALSSVFSCGSVALAIFIRTWSDTLFLQHFNVELLPLFFIWSAFAFAPVTMGYTWLSERISPLRLNTWTMLCFSGLCLFCLTPPKSFLFGTLLLLSLVSPLVNAICWGVILERIDSRQSKRLIPLISSAATVGAIGGGIFAAETIEWGGLTALMGVTTLTLIILALLPSALLLGYQKSDKEKPNKENASTFRLLSQVIKLTENRLLRVIAISTLMLAICTNLVDFLFKAEVQRALRPDEIGPFFARFHAITNAVIFTVQLFVLGRLNPQLSIKWGFPLYPISLSIIGIFCLSPLGWVAFVALRGIDTLLKFTLHTNTENVLLTPLPLLLRTQSKVILKGAIYPLGGLIAGVLIWVASFSAASLDVSVPTLTLCVTFCLCLFWTLSTRRAHLAYRAQLGTNIGLSSSEASLNPSKLAFQHFSDGLKTLQETSETFDALLLKLAEELGLAHEGEKLIEAWRSSHEQRSDLEEWLEVSAGLVGVSGVGLQLEALSRAKRDQGDLNS